MTQRVKQTSSWRKEIKENTYDNTLIKDSNSYHNVRQINEHNCTEQYQTQT